MVLQVVIAVVLVAAGAAILAALYRVSRGVLEQAGKASQPVPEISPDDIQITGEVGADGLAYLFADDFILPKASGPTALPRDKAFAPESGAEKDPEHWALFMLYTSLFEMYDQASVEFRIVKRDPTFLPPYPQKRWEMQITQRTPFPSTPILGALEVAFDLLRQRQQQRVAQGREEPGEAWFGLDEVVERALRAMRQEISFWERCGVFGDLRNYVASTLIAQGYLIAPGKETWLDRSRSKRLKLNTEAVEPLIPARESLRRRVEAFRRKHGSVFALGEQDAEGVRPAVKDADPQLVVREDEFDAMPLDDCLRLSLYEILISLRQLEPSGDAGM